MSKTKEITDYLAHPRPFLAWTILILSILFNGYALTLQVSSAKLTKELMTAFQIDLPQITYILGFYFYAFFLMQIPVGIIIDRLGPRKIPTLAILVCAAGALTFSQSQSATMLGVSRALLGIGGSFAFLNGLKLVSNWFYTKRFAFMVGVFIGLSALSLLLLDVLLIHLTKAIGWRQAALVFSLIGLIIGCAFFFIVQDAPGAGFSVHSSQQKGSLNFFLKKVFHNPQNWIVGLATGFVIGPLFAFQGLWSKPFPQTTYRLSEATAQLMDVIFVLGYAIGAPFFARISTSIGRRKIFMPWGIAVAILMLLLIIYPPYLGVQIIAICYFIMGFAASTIYLGYITVHEINVPRVATTGLGIANMFFGAFAAMSRVLIVVFLQLGLTITHETYYTTQNFQVSLLRIPIYLFIGLIFTLFIRETHCKQVYSYD